MIFGDFIIRDNPSIPNSVANGPSSTNPNAANPASDWPKWIADNPVQINLNETGGIPYKTVSPNGAPVTQFRMPGLANNITAANAYTWEGGRGQRCEFWKSLSPFVPQ